jgi:hypothetical protein
VHGELEHGLMVMGSHPRGCVMLTPCGLGVACSRRAETPSD